MSVTENRDAARKRPVRYLRGETREKRILEAGRAIFLQGGWDSFSMERVAEALACSRPLVYAHFPSKEELLLALAIESKLKRLGMSALVLKFQGRSRERMVALDQMETFLFERYLPIELFVTSARLRVKTSNERQERLKELELQTHAIGASIVEEGLAAGDLPRLKHFNANKLYFALWTSVWGATYVKRSDFPYEAAGIENPTAVNRLALLYMLDGFGWRPLTDEWDYRATTKRVEEEIFSTEAFKEASAGL